MVEGERLSVKCLGILASAFLASASAGAAAAAANYSQDLSRPLNLSPARPTRAYIAMSTNFMSIPTNFDSLFATDYYLYVAWRDDRWGVVSSALAALKRADTPENRASYLATRAAGSALVDLAGLELWSGNVSVLNGDLNTAYYNNGGGVSAFSYTVVPGRPRWIPGELQPGGGGPSAPGVPETWVLGQSRQQYTSSYLPDLKNFPWDDQNPFFTIGSMTSDVSELEIVPTPAAVAGLLPPTSPPGFNANSPRAEVASLFNEGSQQTFPRVRLRFTLTRIATFYSRKFVGNVVLLVLQAFFAITIRGDSNIRISAIQVAVICMLNWQMLLVIDAQNRLPATGYFTRMDFFLALGYGAIFALYAYAAWANGYFKPLQYLSNRLSMRDGPNYITVRRRPGGATKSPAAGKEGAEGAEGAVGAGGPALGADAPAPAPAGAATVKVVPPEPTNDLAVIFRRFVCPEGRFRSLCGARNWADVNIHRKIDIVVVGIAGGFFAIGCALILAWY